jgi:hypothetical protein
MPPPISHALVLPDANFLDWFRAAEAYTAAFPRVVVVRSPTGMHLNPFRSVSAVQPPGMWPNNDAVRYIRSTYRNVVLIDLLRVSRPEDLRARLAERIARRDRYGETLNADNHLFNRFVMTWPSEARPARIVQPFGVTVGTGRNEGIDILTTRGARIRSGTTGTVTVIQQTPNALGYGAYVQVAAYFEGTMYILTYGGLQNINARLGQIMRVGDLIGEAAGSSMKIVVQRPGRGQKGFKLPDVINPMHMIYWDGLRFRPTIDGLRLRESPSLDATPVGQVYMSDLLDTLQLHGVSLYRAGTNEQWLRVRAPSGRQGWAAAWYLEAVESTELPPPTGVDVSGVNLDIQHPLGKPAADRLRGMGWVRFPYNVSRGVGSVDFNAAERLYRPFIERYAAAGLRVMLVLTHQTYGEGQGYNWASMTPEAWRRLARDFANVCRDTATRYARSNIVAAYQIWNEQDSAPGSTAAVAIPAAEYGNLLAEAIRAIRSVDTRARIITGGHISGAGNGPSYARATIAAMPAGVRPDGIAFHAYGLGAPGSSARYAPFGAVGPVIRAYEDILDRPVWITEWGVLDLPNDSAGDVAQYATSFINHIKRSFGQQVATALWYAWADGMHNGYGLVNRDDRPKEPLFTQYKNA